MEFKDIVYIAGKSGLYEMIGNRPNGLIAKSLADGSTQFYSSRIFQFTPLDTIEMFSTDDNVPLRKIMQMAKDNLSTHAVPDANAGNEILKKYFKAIFPSYDEERVKMSDIKKFVKWFAICKDIDFAEKESKDTAAKEETVVEEKEAKPKKAAAKKTTETASSTEEIVKEKKPRAKKKTE